MDQNEVGKGMLYRHPWELSRTKMLIGDWDRYISSLRGDRDGSLLCVNVGAGDMFFDDVYLAGHGDVKLYAVDIGYDLEDKEVKASDDRCLTRSIDNIPEDIVFDYSIMMDSLEYFPDDRKYIEKLAARVRSGGYMFFSLPAYKRLYSDHDVHVGNLRRYDKSEAETLFSGIDGIKVVYSRYFFYSLYIMRSFQVNTGSKIDPDRKVTTGWKHRENSITTKLVKGLLDMDYKLGKHLPGLSLMVVCQKQ